MTEVGLPLSAPSEIEVVRPPAGVGTVDPVSLPLAGDSGPRVYLAPRSGGWSR